MFNWKRTPKAAKKIAVLEIGAARIIGLVQYSKEELRVIPPQADYSDALDLAEMNRQMQAQERS